MQYGTMQCVVSVKMDLSAVLGVKSLTESSVIQYAIKLFLSILSSNGILALRDQLKETVTSVVQIHIVMHLECAYV